MVVFWKTYAPTADRFAEVLCGLVMVLTFTLAGNIYGAEVRDIVIGATGCALAWGIIDGVTLVLNSMFQRGYRNTLIQRVQQASPDKGVAILRDEFNGTLSTITSEEDRERIYRSFVQSAPTMHVEPARVTKHDSLGLLSLITLEALASLFVIVPVLVLGETRGAIRVSNILLVIMLFMIGYDRARKNAWSLTGRIGTGLATMALGVVLVFVAIVMGG